MGASRPRRAWVESHARAITVVALAFLWLGVSIVLAVWFSGQIHDWSVMTDELLYAKLATSIAETLSPLPTVHGISIGVYSQLYPLLIAPLFGTMSPPDAFRAAHWLNAFVMASAAFPAYLLARQVVGRAWSLAVAALSILVPWMILTGFLMTESAAYPAFLWAFLGLQLAVAEPSRRRDLLAAGALVLAALARTQFVALALILPLAVAAVEISEARNLRRGLRAAFEKHRLLAALYGVALVGAAIVAAVDSAGGVLGVYAVTVEEGSLAPSGIWGAAARHVDAVAIGCGLVPFVLGGGWILATVARPRDRRERSLAWLSLATVVVFTFVVASFGVRFGAEVVRDRYLFYVVPLLLVATAAALSSGEARKRVAIGAGLVTLFFAATAASLPFTIYPAIWVDSPASVLNELLIEQSGGLSTGTFVALLGLFTGLVLILALLLAPRPLLATAVVGTLVVFSVLTLRSEVDRILSSTGPERAAARRAARSRPRLGGLRGAGGRGGRARRLPRVDRMGHDRDPLVGRRALEPASGARVPRHRRDVRVHPVPARDDRDRLGDGSGVGHRRTRRTTSSALPATSRFQLAGREIAENVGLVVRSVEQPPRALWATSGLEPDGWTRPGEPARLRVYGPGRVSVTLRAPDDAPAQYRDRASATTRSTAQLEAGAERREQFVLCEPFRRRPLRHEQRADPGRPALADGRGNPRGGRPRRPDRGPARLATRGASVSPRAALASPVDRSERQARAAGAVLATRSADPS